MMKGGHNDTSNFPLLASRSSLLLDSSCQAVALREDGIPFLQRNFTYNNRNSHVISCVNIYTHVHNIEIVYDTVDYTVRTLV